MVDTQVIQLAQALPEIISLVTQNPDQTSAEFLEQFATISQTHNLSSEQTVLALLAHNTYRQDRRAVYDYRDLVCQGDQTTGQPFLDIENNPAAKTTFLGDMHVINPSLAEVRDRFHLEETCPSCFVVRFDGTAEELAKALGDADRGGTAGFFYERYFTEPDGQTDPAIIDRMNLLDHRCIFYTSPSVEARIRGDIANRPDQTRLHELRHYYANLFTRNNQPPSTPHDYLVDRALDEIQGHVAVSGSFNLDNILYHRLSSFLGNTPIGIEEYRSVVGELLDTLSQIERLLTQGFNDREMLGNIAILSNNPADLTRRLSRLGKPEASMVHTLASVAFYMPIGLKQARTTVERAMAINHTLYLQIIARLPENCPPEEIAELQDNIAFRLKDHYYSGIGVLPHEIIERSPEVLRGIENLEAGFQQRGYQITPKLAEVRTKILGRLTEARQEARKTRLWPLFLDHLGATHPDLLASYETYMESNHSMPRLQEYQPSREKIERIYQDWQKAFPD
jgi:hypothetical protein